MTEEELAAEKAKADAGADAAIAAGTIFDPADPPFTPPSATQGEVDAIIALLKALHGRSGMDHATIVRTEREIKRLRGE